MKKITIGILSGLSALLLLLCALLAGVFIASTTPAFYRYEYKKYKQAENIGISEDDLMRITGSLLDYLNGDRDNLDMQAVLDGQAREVFTQREKDHMIDVRELIQLGRMVMIYGGILGLCLIALFVHINRKNPLILRSVGMGMLIGAGVMLGGLGAVGLYLALDFTAGFIKFHEIFFTNDLWLLNPQDMLILMVPEPFFMDCAVLIGITFVVGLGAVCGYAFYLVKSSRRGGEEGEGKPFIIHAVASDDGDSFFVIENDEQTKTQERPDAKEIFARMGLSEDMEETEAQDDAQYLTRSRAVAHRQAVPKVSPEQIWSKDGVNMRLEMKLDFRMEKDEQGRVMLSLDPDSTPYVNVTGIPGLLSLTIDAGHDVQEQISTEQVAQLHEEEPDNKKVPPAPTPEELLQQMDRLMSGFPKDIAKGG